MKGKIIKAIAGFYYLHTPHGIFACRARGVFRKDGIKPLVGDNAEFDVLCTFPDEHENEAGGLLIAGEGNLVRVLPRQNALIRPAAANIDQALLVFALHDPEPNLNLLDRFLIYMGQQKIPVVLYFNKSDLDRDGRTAEHFQSIYEAAGCRVLFGTAKTEPEDVKRRLLEVLSGKTTVLAGPSGVGKSSLTNLLHTEAGMEVGALSEKIRRGKQTTRHTELFALDEKTYLLDTPGFTSLLLPELSAEEVRYYFAEFSRYESSCRFSGCAHVSEPEKFCAVKQAVARGEIAKERYENYLQIYAEQKKAQRY